MKEGYEKKLMIPDTSKLVAWLLDKFSELDAENARLKARLEPIDNFFTHDGMEVTFDDLMQVFIKCMALKEKE